MGGAGDGDGGNGGELRPSLSTDPSGGFLGVFDLGLAVAVNRVGRSDLGFTAGLHVDSGFGSGSGVVTCAPTPELDLGKAVRLVGEGSEPKPCSSSPHSSRDIPFTSFALLPLLRLEFCESPGSGGLSFEDLVLGLPFFSSVSGSRGAPGRDGDIGSGSMEVEAGPEAIVVEAGVLGAGGLV